jgi:hypothetical protein
MSSLPLFPDHVRCETCRHWTGASTTPLHHECAGVTAGLDRSGPYLVSDYYAEEPPGLMTPPDFACSRWEPKP